MTAATQGAADSDPPKPMNKPMSGREPLLTVTSWSRAIRYRPSLSHRGALVCALVLTAPLKRCMVLPMHRRREIQSLEMHRRIAAMMKGDPSRVLGKAMANLQAWLARHQGSALEPVFKEWQELLTCLSISEIAAFIVGEDDRAIRMRQSSPFAGVLSPQEVWAIKRSHEAA